jgi:BirA family biotin operon repressor/biotin-[acetyl-CoA-carboxylase] ligase
LADSFDRARFTARLGAQRLGQRLVVRESTASTNDDAWEALGALGDGAVVLALEQTQGRGRAGRRWEHAPGRGLALSVALHPGCDVRQAGMIPLAAGLAVVQACHALGVPAARLKWPNDVQVGTPSWRAYCARCVAPRPVAMRW